ncbi:MAG: GntG family PLP-dependent aldolase [Myxococcota bacterium]|nr:GntG family PLP-dependent aldolase [Myxococcota bacterium]
MRIREFRSDTLTRPTQAMREAMLRAEVGDDVYEEDPTVNRLQALAAKELSKEAALFVPSGTAGNQCALGAHCLPGNEAIVSDTVHMVQYEAGAPGALWGVQLRTAMPSAFPYLTVDDILPRLRSDNIHHPKTGLIILENALSDGTVMPLSAMNEVQTLAQEHGIPIHLDGARLFNAAIALGVEPAEIAAMADSVMVCLSKGLGAPVGSLLLGSRAFVEQARRRRKILGGGMRQVGVLAAPAMIALTQGREGLIQDHKNARLLAELLGRIHGIDIDLAKVQTNMLFVKINAENKTEADFVAFMRAKGFAMNAPTSWGIRLVTSYEVDQADVRALAAAASEYFTM